jgi:hypothetical protein
MSEAPERFKFSLGRFFMWLTIICIIMASGRSRRIAEVPNFSLSFMLIGTVLAVLVAWVGINVVRPLLKGQEFLAVPQSQRTEWIALCVAIAMWLAPFAYQFLFSD